MKKKAAIVQVQLSDLEFARLALKVLVRSRDDFQSIRKNMDNRLGKKASGEDQDVDKRSFDDIDALEKYAKVARDQEKLIEKDMLNELKKFPVYNEFLVKVKGVGPVSAGWIVSEFNIHIADTVSKLWQFSGMNPGMVHGKKRKENKDGTYTFTTSDNMVRGDKRTPGFVAPFNGRLRVALLGVMADGFIKAQNSYAMDYYYPYKNRKENSSTEVLHWKSKGKPAEMIPWKDVSKGHRDSAAKRYMVKAFLKDLYVAWRTVEGLPVREPYAEEYLGKKHAVEAKKVKRLKMVK
jgi:hypothetical protein